MWDPTPVGALSHGSGLNGNDPLPRHVSGIIIRNGRLSPVLGDDHSHMGGSDDMKADVVIMEILYIGDFIFMFLGLNVVLYIVGYVLHCICHIN